jgi:CheY-like chemotaxis protein
MDVLLADDDSDDCLLFKDALADYPGRATLTTVSDGEQLMAALVRATSLPDVLFLDLNMPRKNGFECLLEIRSTEKLKSLPIIIFSTSFDPDIAHKLYLGGAHFYMRKPSEFRVLTQVLHKALSFVNQAQLLKPEEEGFILHS